MPSRRLPPLLPSDLPGLVRTLNLRLAELDESSNWLIRGTGSPEGVVSAVVGAVYLRSNGGAGTTLYVKESGTGKTGWVGK